MSAAQSGSTGKYVVIGAGKYLLLQVLLALHTCRDARCLVICAPGTRFLARSTLTSEYMEADFGGKDDDAIIKRIHRFAEAAVDVVAIPADCIAARWIDRVRRRLAVFVIPMPDADLLDRFDNKWRFYQFCVANGLKVPLTRFAEDKYRLDFKATADALGLPFVVKPVNEQASIGTCVIASEDEYRRRILDNEAYQHAPLIAQRHIAGRDVGLNLLAVDGRLEAMAIQRRVDPGHDGSRIEFFAHGALENVAHIVSRESRYTGVMNIDARIEDGTGAVYLLESNPRFWRSLSASVWCGLNFVERSVYRRSAETVEAVETLTTGHADTYYHPLFRPSLWRHALFDKTHRGRMLRVMFPEICTLAMSSRILAARACARVRPNAA
jgi:predicted ATP-grasp superfamily ATP-dependent carboligase